MQNILEKRVKGKLAVNAFAHKTSCAETWETDRELSPDNRGPVARTKGNTEGTVGELGKVAEGEFLRQKAQKAQLKGSEEAAKGTPKESIRR